MKKHKWLIPAVITLILLLTGGIITYRILTDKTKLTSTERNWINSNINNVQNINVIKDENIFSKDGHGVFYDFLNSFSEKYGITLNTITYESNNTPSGIKLNYTTTLNKDSQVFYTDHYVVLSKNNNSFNTNNDLNNLTIGILNNDLEYVKSYLKEISITYNGYDTLEDLLKSLETNSYIILPRMKYLDTILKENLVIVYHLSDINAYYTLETTSELFSNILNKYFMIYEEQINEAIKNEEFTIFTNALNISASDIDKLLSVNYKYGFINNSPYEVIMSGNYGGIVAEYLQEFSEFSKVYFDITKYRNNSKLLNAINKGKVDLYFDFNQNISTNFKSTQNGITGSLVVLTHKDNPKVINSIYGLQGEDVYVEKGSNLLKYLSSIENVNIHTYSGNKEAFKLNNKNVIIVMDNYIYDYYRKSKFNNYVSKYTTFIDNKYTFKINSNYETLNLLLDKYINYLDNKEVIQNGLNSHTETIANGSILNNIAKYFIISIVAVLVIGFVVYKKSKKIRIAKRLKKTDRIRFIDELTCLKNRNYLSDFMKTWSNNTIYPQAVIVIDLNNLNEINDKYGVSEGDKQIQAAANALIKTQLDNSDLMRSDGNEFVIYTVGYNQKQIINYLHKLNKELKKLPYNYGAEFGYSIILNNLKTVEDALQEATMDMKSKKKEANHEN